MHTCACAHAPVTPLHGLQLLGGRPVSQSQMRQKDLVTLAEGKKAVQLLVRRSREFFLGVKK